MHKLLSTKTYARLRSSVSSTSDCRSRGREFEPQLSHITFVEIDHDIIFTPILPLPLIYPRHLWRGVYSFRLSVCMFIRTSVPFVELLQSFTVKQLEWSISHQPLIRKHSYLDHRYPGRFAFIPWLLTPGSMSWGGARGQNLGHI